MEYLEFERILSSKRIGRYLESVGGDTKKAMTLYRCNLRLSQELFTVVSCFEVALRNAIDNLMVPKFGNDWHSGYYPWIHGKFICKGEGKWRSQDYTK